MVNNLDKIKFQIPQDVIFEMEQLSLSLKEDAEGYKDPVSLCKAEGVDLCVNILKTYKVGRLYE